MRVCKRLLLLSSLSEGLTSRSVSFQAPVHDLQLILIANFIISFAEYKEQKVSTQADAKHGLSLIIRTTSLGWPMPRRLSSSRGRGCHMQYITPQSAHSRRIPTDYGARERNMTRH
jgi:hypothetical protein